MTSPASRRLALTPPRAVEDALRRAPMTNALTGPGAPVTAEGILASMEKLRRFEVVERRRDLATIWISALLGNENASKLIADLIRDGVVEMRDGVPEFVEEAADVTG